MERTETASKATWLASIGLSPRQWYTLAGMCAAGHLIALIGSSVVILGAILTPFVPEFVLLCLACLAAAAVAYYSKPGASVAFVLGYLVLAGNTEWWYWIRATSSPEAKATAGASSPKLELRTPPVIRLGGDLRPVWVARGPAAQVCPEQDEMGALTDLVPMGRDTRRLDPVLLARGLGAPLTIDHAKPDLRLSVGSSADSRIVRINVASDASVLHFDYWRASEVRRSDAVSPRLSIGGLVSWIFACNALQQTLAPSLNGVRLDPARPIVEAVNAMTTLFPSEGHELPTNAVVTAEGPPEPVGEREYRKITAHAERTAPDCAPSGLDLSPRTSDVVGCVNGPERRFITLDRQSDGVWDVRVLDPSGQPQAVYFFRLPSFLNKVSTQPVRSTWRVVGDAVEFEVLSTNDKPVMRHRLRVEPAT